MINTRAITEDEKTQIRELMSQAGFKEYESLAEDILLTSGMHFYIDISAQDKDTVIKHCSPNHFEPYGERAVHVFTSYVTSNVRGVWRKFRGRKRYTHFDTGNIFSYSEKGSDNPVENVRIFLDKYSRLEYNRPAR